MSTRVTRSAAALGNNKVAVEEKPIKKSPIKKAGKTMKAKSTKPASKSERPSDNGDAQLPESIYDFTVNNIKGEPVSLSKYKGSVCIIVNVASRCGHTKSNYEQFVELHKKYGDSKDVKILAFPCNQFGAQEPGTPEAICKFVEKYGVEFDMFEKINVNGPKAHPLYKFLCAQLPDPKGKGANIKWNFTKFIIDTEGKPVERFASAVKPNTLVETLKKYW